MREGVVVRAAARGAVRMVVEAEEARMGAACRAMAAAEAMARAMGERVQGKAAQGGAERGGIA